MNEKRCILRDGLQPLIETPEIHSLINAFNRGEAEAVWVSLGASFDDVKRGHLRPLWFRDDYAHKADVGDRVLVETAKVLSAHVRLGDTVGRWGGEEFLMVLLETDEKKAVQIAESIRKDIAALRVLPRGKGFTASFGVARITPRETFDTFYQRVDRALYRAKHGGKNRVCLDEK